MSLIADFKVFPNLFHRFPAPSWISSAFSSVISKICSNVKSLQPIETTLCQIVIGHKQQSIRNKISFSSDIRKLRASTCFRFAFSRFAFSRFSQKRFALFWMISSQFMIFPFEFREFVHISLGYKQNILHLLSLVYNFLQKFFYNMKKDSKA